jgi:hypothetical protein
MENADWLMVDESDFAYNLTWKYTPNENGESWWRKERDFQLTLSNWKNQQMSCREFYLEPSAYFTTGKAIKRGDKAGGGNRGATVPIAVWACKYKCKHAKCRLCF